MKPPTFSNVLISLFDIFFSLFSLLPTQNIFFKQKKIPTQKPKSAILDSIQINSPILTAQFSNEENVLIGSADGMLAEVDFNQNRMSIQMTGPNLEPVRTVKMFGNVVFSGSRDCLLRKYVLQ